jgi:hypothetical protein
METVLHSPIERERARIMTFSYHVADSTLRVYEPPQEGSGLYQVRRARHKTPPPPPPLTRATPAAASLLPQGEFAKRHVPYSPSGSVYTPFDFFFGAKLHVSGREFTVVDADVETRELMLARYGVELGEPHEIPRTYIAPKLAYGHSLHANKVVCDVGDMEDPCVCARSAANAHARRAAHPAAAPPSAPQRQRLLQEDAGHEGQVLRARVGDAPLRVRVARDGRDVR